MSLVITLALLSVSSNGLLRSGTDAVDLISKALAGMAMFLVLAFIVFTAVVDLFVGSATNILGPLMTSFALVIAVAQKHDKKIGIGSLIATMLPYSIAFLLAWTTIPSISQC